MTTDVTFGTGGAEPYASALRDESTNLTMRLRLETGTLVETIDVGRWSADADATDLSLLFGASGPVLDIGCGPGRMVKAAMGLGLPALGIDVAPAALEVASGSGLSVLYRSVFDRVPREGSWKTVLLIDGNIGIGGEPTVLLSRCADILDDAGELIVETYPEAERNLSCECTLVDEQGGESSPFPWAQIGSDILEKLATGAGLVVTQTWAREGRTFCRLRRSRPLPTR